VPTRLRVQIAGELALRKQFLRSPSQSNCCFSAEAQERKNMQSYAQINLPMTPPSAVGLVMALVGFKIKNLLIASPF
jgi:hypothetical protein